MFQVELALSEHPSFSLQALHYCLTHFPFVAAFDGNGVTYPRGTFPKVIHAGRQAHTLQDQILKDKTCVGIISYDYKNQLEKLTSSNPMLVDVPDTLFFEATCSIFFEDSKLVIQTTEELDIYSQISSYQIPKTINPPLKVVALTSQEQYIANVKAIQQHIEEGDMYELNYCLGYTFEHADWDAFVAYIDLMKLSPMPFSVFLKAENQYLVGASPERFLKKNKDTIIAQPIKGTIRRGETPQEDQELAYHLLHSEKERAENLMIVDLMRNDLSKVSEIGAVKVEELFGVYPFPRVHQMISTVTSQLKASADLKTIIDATFPMGSMTGAPKIKCMELIDSYEDFRRGWFSGSIGIVEPSGDFDFNVIIRSIMYDQNTGKGYFAVGSAITYDADPVYEYEECQLKASAIRQVLERGIWN